MNCPSCGTDQSAPAPACAACGLTLKLLDGRFGFVPRHRPEFTDLTQSLTAREIRKLEAAQANFCRTFPGIRMSVFLCKLPVGRDVGEFCFWMINRGHFAEAEAKLEKNRTILLLIDTDGPAASIMAGYGLEHILSRHELQEALQMAEQPLRERHFFHAAMACLNALAPVLRRNITAISGGARKEPAAVLHRFEEPQKAIL